MFQDPNGRVNHDENILQVHMLDVAGGGVVHVWSAPPVLGQLSFILYVTHFHAAVVARPHEIQDGHDKGT